MKQPTLEEVKEHFKNAKEVRCLCDRKFYDITEGINRDIHEFCSDFWIELEKVNVNLWDFENGYADIISYKEDNPVQQEFTVSFETVGGVSVTLKGCNMDNINTIINQIK